MLAIFPILFPVVLMVIHLLIKKDKVAAISGIVGSMLLLSGSIYLFTKVFREGMLSTVVGGWDAPFGISIVIDPMSALFLLVSSVIVVAISVFSINYREKGKYQSKYYFFFFTLILGINGAFTTGDIFNMYVWFEVMLLSSFVLINLGFSREQMRSGIKYLSLIHI